MTTKQDFQDDAALDRVSGAAKATMAAAGIIALLALLCSGCSSPSKLMTEHARDARRGVAVLISSTVAAEAVNQPAVDALGRSTLQHLDEIVRLGELTDR